ncbi:unnamed protein product [Jaminaea pallidilutea]
MLSSLSRLSSIVGLTTLFTVLTSTQVQGLWLKGVPLNGLSKSCVRQIQHIFDDADLSKCLGLYGQHNLVDSALKHDPPVRGTTRTSQLTAYFAQSFCPNHACDRGNLNRTAHNFHIGCSQQDLAVDSGRNVASLLATSLGSYSFQRDVFCTTDHATSFKDQYPTTTIDGHPLCISQLLQASKHPDLQWQDTYDLLRLEPGIFQRLFLAGDSQVCTECSKALYRRIYIQQNHGKDLAKQGVKYTQGSVRAHLRHRCGDHFLMSPVTAGRVVLDVSGAHQNASSKSNSTSGVQTATGAHNSTGAGGAAAVAAAGGTAILGQAGTNGAGTANTIGASTAMDSNGMAAMSNGTDNSTSMGMNNSTNGTPRITAGPPVFGFHASLEFVIWLECMLFIVLFVMGAPLLVH